jgi:hypothetical protein
MGDDKAPLQIMKTYKLLDLYLHFP